MKRVLVITYYWPPSGGAGVQRWLKFTKYLPDFGWQPVVYTPENPEAPVDDPSLLADIRSETEVVKRHIWEPYTLYKRFIGMRSGDRINAGFLSENEKSEKKEGISVWIRGNLFIPDARRFWIAPSVRFLRKTLRENPVDAIISTGPPHSMHLIAWKLKKQFNIPWIADFRDPWTEIDFYDQLRLTRRSDKKHKTQEKSVLHGADRVVVIGKTMAERFRIAQNIIPAVIPNGYDEADFSENRVAPADDFTIVHVGAINRDRNHDIFWRTISSILEEHQEISARIRIRLIGKLDHSVLASVKTHGLETITEMIPQIPHNQIAEVLQSASLLYLPINNTPNANAIQTGKIFEYLASGRPILGVGPVNGDASEILETSGAGKMIDFVDEAGIRSAIISFWSTWRKGHKRTNSSYKQYSRRILTGKIADILNEISP